MTDSALSDRLQIFSPLPPTSLEYYGADLGPTPIPLRFPALGRWGRILFLDTRCLVLVPDRSHLLLGRRRRTVTVALPTAVWLPATIAIAITVVPAEQFGALRPSAFAADLSVVNIRRL